MFLDVGVGGKATLVLCIALRTSLHFTSLIRMVYDWIYAAPFAHARTHCAAGPVIGYGESCCNATLPEGGAHCNAACDYVALVEKQAKALRAGQCQHPGQHPG